MVPNSIQKLQCSRSMEETLKNLDKEFCIKFSKISEGFEKWASSRRILLRKLRSFIEELEKSRFYSSTGRTIFSSLDVIGTVGSMILDSFQVPWSSAILHTSAAIGCCSLLCNLAELSKKQLILDSVISMISEDEEISGPLREMFWKLKAFDYEVQEIFPYGVDMKTVRWFQEGADNLTHKGLIKKSGGAATPFNIALAVMQSNCQRESDLLKDTDFRADVQLFSRHRFGEKWWKSVKYNRISPFIDITKHRQRLKSFSRKNLMHGNTFFLMSAPLSHMPNFSPVGSIMLNSVFAVHAFMQIEHATRSAELSALRSLEDTMQQEYDDVVKMYEELSPHCD